MSEFRTQTAVNEASGLQAYITGVFTRMGIAVLITAAVSYALYATGLYMVLGLGYILIVLAQLGICFYLTSRIMTMKQSTATTLLYAYAALTGVTFSALAAAFDLPTFFGAFAFSAIMFFCTAIIGHVTDVDLSKFSGIMIGGLIALAIASIASLFIPVLRESLILSYIGIVLFLFLTAWDMQKIRSYYYGTAGGQGTAGANLAVYGAFKLYLNFINLFIRVLQIFGSRSRRR